MILFRVFTGILFILPLVASAEFVEDMAIRIQPAPEQQGYTMDTFGQVVSIEDVYQYQADRKVDTPILSFENCDSVEDCAHIYHENVNAGVPRRIENADTPYAPFPWPCDSVADCAHIYNVNVNEGVPRRIENADTPYAPFPWPCDSVADCAHQIQIREIVVPF